MPLVYAALAWLAGLILASISRLPLELWAWLAGLPIGLLLIWHRDAALRRVHLYLLAFVLAALRYTAAQPVFDPYTLAYWNERGATVIVGQVVQPPEVREQSTLVRVSVSLARIANQCIAVSGLAQWQAPRETDVRYGDQVQIVGALKTPPESAEFSYKDYLARQGVHSIIRTYGGGVKILARDQGDPFFAALYAFRARALATVHALFPEPAAALLAGILLGDDAGIPRALDDAFSATNTAHIIAISGFNMAVLAGILSSLARRLFGEGRATIVVVVGLAVYTLLVGASASVVRAAIMGSLAALALQLRRPNDALNALALAAFVMTVQNPLIIYDLSFQLSFLATLGLIVFVPRLTTAFEVGLARVIPLELARRLVVLLGDSVIVTLAAQITTTPLIVSAFQRLSLVGLAANFLILWAQPAVMVVGGLATLVGMLLPTIGQVIAWIAWAFLQWTILVVQTMASVPFASLDLGRIDVFWIALCYAVVFGVALLPWNTIKPPVPTTPTNYHWPMALSFAFPALVVTAIWFFSLALTLPDNRTRVSFLDAGGAATIVRTPRGGKILIDGGANPNAVLSALGSNLPFWDRSLDLIVLTAADDEHLAGLVAALERYQVRQIVEVNPATQYGAAYQKWRALIADKNIGTTRAQAGLEIKLDDGVVLEVLHPPAARSSRAAVARLRAGNLTVLFADAAETEDQSDLMAARDDPASAVLVAPRRLAPGFLDAVQPQIAIVFSERSTRAQPSAELLATLADTTVLRTGERGTIEIATDGRTFSVKTTR